MVLRLTVFQQRLVVNPPAFAELFMTTDVMEHDQG
jgi:hypothetical protein